MPAITLPLFLRRLLWHYRGGFDRLSWWGHTWGVREVPVVCSCGERIGTTHLPELRSPSGRPVYVLAPRQGGIGRPSVN